MHKFDKSHKAESFSIDETNQRGGRTMTMQAHRPPRTAGQPLGGPNDLPLQANPLPSSAASCLLFAWTLPADTVIGPGLGSGSIIWEFAGSRAAFSVGFGHSCCAMPIRHGWDN